MALILKITSHQGASMGADGVREYTGAGGTIGRAPGNDWVLPDPELFISSQHSVIEVRGDQYVLVDTSTNGTFLNDSEVPIGNGHSATLKHGDRFVVGDYEFTASIEQVIPQRSEPFIDANPVHESDPFGVGGSANATVDPLAGLNSPDIASAPDSVSRRAPSEDPLAHGGSLDPLRGFDLQTDERGLLGGNPQSAPQHGTYGNAVGATGESLLPMTPQPMSPDPTVPPVTSPDTGASQIGDDWDKTGFSPPSPVHLQPPTGPADGVRSPRPQSAPTEPQADPATGPDPFQAGAGQPQSVPPQPVPPVPPPPRTDTLQARTLDTPAPPAGAAAAPGALVGLQRLLETAGLDPQSAQSVATEQLAEEFGNILQIFVNGMMDVLKARAEIKNEFRIAQTRIAPVENNPLKFCVDVRDALYSLFVKQGGGFLPPVAAFEEGFEDIRAHQLAMMAGMRAAFDSVMERLDPASLKDTFDQNLRRSPIFKPLNRVQYWDMYCEMYEDITRDADENFQRLFGEVFAKAYEQQMQRLTSMRRR